MNPLIQLKTTPLLFITLALFCFGLSLRAQAVVPPPDGGYAGGNTAEGQNALFSLTTGGFFNTAVGWLSLHSLTAGNANTAVGAGTLVLNEADGNTAVGAEALLANTTGDGNTANGSFALFNNTVGRGNTGVGAGALGLNDGNFNTAVGAGALALNDTTGNTGVGAAALLINTTGNGNTGVGATALQFNTTGQGNTGVGAEALLNNDGLFNTAVGLDALTKNTTGNGNTAVGAGAGLGTAALGSNTTGDGNTAVGATTGVGAAALGSNTTGGFNTAIGRSALKDNTTGSGNIAVGDIAGDSLTTGDNNIDIGNSGVAAEANTIRIGTTATQGYFQSRTFIAGIYGVTPANNAIPVVIDSAGQLGTASSSARFKKEIKPMDKASEAILGLKPVTFHYKSDTKDTSQFGLISEEVAAVNPDLVVRDGNGEIYTVRYDAVNAMLLNEFLKEHRKNDEQEATIARQQKQIEALTAGLQKVSAQLEASKPAAQVVNNQ